MPRKQFVADLQQAKGFSGPENTIHGVQAGEDDGQVSFLYVHSNSVKPVFVTAGVDGETTSIVLTWYAADFTAF